MKTKAMIGPFKNKPRLKECPHRGASFFTYLKKQTSRVDFGPSIVTQNLEFNSFFVLVDFDSAELILYILLS